MKKEIKKKKEESLLKRGEEGREKEFRSNYGSLKFFLSIRLHENTNFWLSDRRKKMLAPALENKLFMISAFSNEPSSTVDRIQSFDLSSNTTQISGV